MNQIVIGLSGHIDHGKTSIIHSLTGKNTDNLKEEINRGMTINIGFAFIDNDITLVDVPGHEKFIKNMVAGISSIDYALLVIAADDGIMPQTIEHFEILKLLNIRYGSIIINKIDMVDKDWLAMVEEDIREFVKDSFLSNAPIHKISTVNNEGIQKLKEYIISLKSQLKNREKFDRGVFSLFVDRVFISKGFGHIITGTVGSGKVEVGDKLNLLPDNKEVKVRGMQTHNESITKLFMGDRAALNIQSNQKISLNRGSHISTLNYYHNIETAIVKIEVLSKFKRGLKNNDRIRVYIGTQEIMARIFFSSENKDLMIKNKAIGLLKFEKMIIAPFYENFIVRMFSPLVTIGGGNILDVGISGKWRKISQYMLKFKTDDNFMEAIENIIENRILNPFSFESLSEHLSLSKEKLIEVVSQIKNIKLVDGKWLITDNLLEKNKIKIIEVFENFHKENQFRSGLLKKEILNRINVDDDFLEYILLQMKDLNLIKEKNNLLSMKNFEISLSKKDLDVYKNLLEIIDKEKFQTSSFIDLKNSLLCNENLLKQLINVGVSNNDLILINGELLFTMNNFKDLKKIIYNYFKDYETLDIGKFKKMINTSRKYAVPLLEYLDKLDITFRDNNERKLKR